MKKKIFAGIGALALITMLTLNVSISNTNNNNDLSLKGLFSLAQASAEGDHDLCVSWCTYFSGGICTLHVGGSSGEYWIICTNGKWI